MQLLTIIIATILSIFSTVVMSYISMATPIGPWIAPTLVLCTMLFFKFIKKGQATKDIALATSAGSVGGILATAMAFSFPTLYFLEPLLFQSLMDQPLLFCSILSASAFACGSLGIWLAALFEPKMIVEQNLAFPIGQLVYKTLSIQNNIKKAYELFIGFISTFIFCLLQDGFWKIQSFVPKTIQLLPTIRFSVWTIPILRFDLWPMLWAIGFIAGHIIAIPLAIGAISRYLLLGPIHSIWFSQLTTVEFLLAFCSGIIVASAIFGFFKTGKIWLKKIKNLKKSEKKAMSQLSLSRALMLEFLAIAVGLVTLLTYLNFSFTSQIYLITLTSIAAYQVSAIAGKIGLALLGRYATFVMLPALFLFDMNATHLVMISMCVEVVAGVATDVLFSKKVAYLMNINRSLMRKYQYFGLLVSSLCLGFVFWFLINHFGLGSEFLFGQKAQARALLIHAQQFNLHVLGVGALFGLLLQYIKINPTLVFGGLLMPINISLGLVFGGFLTLFTKNRHEWEPFWSGVFASNSIWMMLKAVLSV